MDPEVSLDASRQAGFVLPIVTANLIWYRTLLPLFHLCVAPSLSVHSTTHRSDTCAPAAMF